MTSVETNLIESNGSVTVAVRRVKSTQGTPGELPLAFVPSVLRGFIAGIWDVLQFKDNFEYPQKENSTSC